MKTIVMALLLISNFASAAPSVMQQINGKRIEIVSITGVSTGKQDSGGEPYVAECPNGQAANSFLFQSIVAGRDQTFAAAADSKCARLNFNTLAFQSVGGSRAHIALANGEGRPAFNYRVVENTQIDVDCRTTIVKGILWDGLNLICRDIANPRAQFLFSVK